jgi:asparagine synthase (glutamine-hydrolysing)
MCGIAGAVTREGYVEREAMSAMCRALRHRGPDSSGIVAGDGFALAAQRLAITDIQHGDQPIANEDSSVVVVLNGAVYNHEELRGELERAGHRFTTRTDTEVIAHLYEELGDACVLRLRGMFAFAVWDRRRRRLLAARDRVGKKPLYYVERGEELWFASNIRALLDSGAAPTDVDHDAVDLLLHYQCVPAPRTAFSAIRKLPPAHILTWQDGRLVTSRYWKLSFRDRWPELGEPEASELVRDALLEATRLRLRGDVPVGALLSGGVDSSGVVAAMARLTPGPVKAFSIGFDVSDHDETSAAAEVARLHGAEHHVLRLDAGWARVLPELVWHYGEPFADSSALANFAVAELAGEHVTVVLNGDGGDEVFAGYPRYREPADGPEAYAAERAIPYFDPAARAELYTEDFLSALGEADWRAVIGEPYAASDAPTQIERLLDVDLQTYLPDDLLVKMDVATMAHAVEARSPLLDQELLELVAGLPAWLKFDGVTSKRVLKRALRGWLPDSILDRPKMGFRIPFGHWLRHELRDLPGDVLLDPRALDRGIFREQSVRTLVDEHLAGERDHAGRLWTLLVLELWFRTHVDCTAGDGPAALAVA